MALILNKANIVPLVRGVLGIIENADITGYIPVLIHL
jgi:hypothetical protein